MIFQISKNGEFRTQFQNVLSNLLKRSNKRWFTESSSFTHVRGLATSENNISIFFAQDQRDNNRKAHEGFSLWPLWPQQSYYFWMSGQCRPWNPQRFLFRRSPRICTDAELWPYFDAKYNKIAVDFLSSKVKAPWILWNKILLAVRKHLISFVEIKLQCSPLINKRR